MKMKKLVLLFISNVVLPVIYLTVIANSIEVWFGEDDSNIDERHIHTADNSFNFAWTPLHISYESDSTKDKVSQNVPNEHSFADVWFSDNNATFSPVFDNSQSVVLDRSVDFSGYIKIYERLEELAGNNSLKMKLQSLGKSNFNLSIPHVILTEGEAAIKPIILLDSLIHGDKTDVLPAMMKLIEFLLKPKYSFLLYNIEWHFLPIINPDGFVAGTRKNVNSDFKSGECTGVDLNRNFADAVDPTSQDLCNRDYSVNAFSERETVALRDFFLKKGSQIKYYLSLHGCHENRIIPVMAKNGDKATFKNMKNMFQKARELVRLGNLKGVGYALRSPMDLDRANFPEESTYEVQEAPNGNALTYAVDAAGVSKAFVICHGPNQDSQKIVDGLWFMARNVALDLEVTPSKQGESRRTSQVNSDSDTNSHSQAPLSQNRSQPNMGITKHGDISEIVSEEQGNEDFIKPRIIYN